MVVPYAGHLALRILLCFGDVVRARVARPAAEGLLGERSECRGGERREGEPRPPVARAVLLVRAGVVLARLRGVEVAGHRDDVDEEEKQVGGVQEAASRNERVSGC